MINKADLQSIISKYYLNAMNEAVRWDIQDNKLTIKFTAPDKTMIGVVTCDKFELEDSSIGISNTTQLNKLLNITTHSLPSDFKVHYNSNLIKEIMYCNKDVANCVMGINLEGIMKLSFDNGSIKSEYYIVAKEL
jgi:antitoxin component YwqK of YwqJK toxin-antitoxin module